MASTKHLQKLWACCSKLQEVSFRYSGFTDCSCLFNLQINFRCKPSFRESGSRNVREVRDVPWMLPTSAPCFPVWWQILRCCPSECRPPPASWLGEVAQ